MLHTFIGGHSSGCSALNPLVKHRQQDQRQEGGAEDAADDDGGERALNFRARTRRDGHGHEAKTGDQRGHEHGAQSSKEPSRTESRTTFPLPGAG